MVNKTMNPVRDAVRTFNKYVLPYGTSVDWLRNVLAAGGATITVGGETFNVVGPEIIDAATAAPQLSPKRRRAYERFGIDKFVKVTLAPSKG